MPKDLIAVSLMYVPIALLSLIMSIEVYNRDRTNPKGRLAALIMLAMSSFYLAEYVRDLMPIKYSYAIMENWTNPSIMIALCAGTHFYSLFAKLQEKVGKWVLYGICYTPFLVLFYIAQTGKNIYIFPSVAREGLWNKFSIHPVGYFILISSACAYMMVYIILIYRAWSRAATPKIKKRFQMLLIGCVILFAWNVLFGIVFEALKWNRHTPTFFFAFGTLFWFIFIRIATVKYDFLLSDDRKYRIVFDSSPLGIFLLDRHGIVLEANAVAHRLLGVSWLVGCRFTYWLSENSRQTVQQVYESNFQEQIPYHTTDSILQMNNGIELIIAVESEFIEVEDDIIQFVMARDVTELKKAEQQILQLAYQDSLTELANRRQLELSFRELRESKPNQLLGLMLLDLDRFKYINDALGHDTGDQLLKLIACLLRDKTQGRGLVARLGGDEFIVLFSGMEEEAEIAGLGEQIVSCLSESIIVDRRELFVSASAGICFSPKDGDDIPTLIKHADIAMYEAKAMGKNQLRAFDPSMSRIAAEKLGFENELRKAMDRNELFLHYQPQLDLARNKVAGVEALLRCQSPVYGLVGPDKFIPVAEDTGLIIALGAWVLEEACRQAKAWVDLGYEGQIAVNVSSKQFLQPDFAGLIDDILRRTGLAADRLCLELTESTALLDIVHTQQQLDNLNESGVTIALDDFGTGYSSLSMLRNLSFDQIKIDRSFISGILNHQRERAIVESIIHLIHNFNVTIVAEGVENEQQQDILRELGCDMIQGYYFARPMPPEEAVKKLC